MNTDDSKFTLQNSWQRQVWAKMVIKFLSQEGLAAEIQRHKERQRSDDQKENENVLATVLEFLTRNIHSEPKKFWKILKESKGNQRSELPTQLKGKLEPHQITERLYNGKSQVIKLWWQTFSRPKLQFPRFRWEFTNWWKEVDDKVEEWLLADDQWAPGDFPISRNEIVEIL